MQNGAQLTALHMSKNSGFWFHNKIIITHRGHNGKDMQNIEPKLKCVIK